MIRIFGHRPVPRAVPCDYNNIRLAKYKPSGNLQFSKKRVDKFVRTKRDNVGLIWICTKMNQTKNKTVCAALYLERTEHVYLHSKDSMRFAVCLNIDSVLKHKM